MLVERLHPPRKLDAHEGGPLSQAPLPLSRSALRPRRKHGARAGVRRGADLPSLPLERRGGFLFTSLEPRSAFDDALRAAPGEGELGFDPNLFDAIPSDLHHDPRRDRDFLVEAHWVLYVENYLEGFHVPYVHPGLAKALDLDGYRTFLLEGGNIQLGVARPGELAFEGTDHAAYYLWLYPNLMFNVYPWGVSVNIVEPLGLERTRVRFRSFVSRPELLGRGAGGSLDEVEFEDETVVESEQRGIRSRLYRRGRYSPKRERGVHQFHRLLQAALA